MRLKEQRLWDRMRKACATSGVLALRVENVMGVGMPDVVCACNGVVTWVELKAVDEVPVRPNTPLLGKENGLSAEQKNWHLNWNKHRASSLIVVGIGSSEVLTLLGCDADEVNKLSHTAMRAKAWCSGMAPLMRILGAHV